MLSRMILVGSFGILVVAQLLFAHGEDHIEGTVTKLNAKHIVVRTGFGIDAKTITILLTKYTRYHPGGAEATRGFETSPSSAFAFSDPGSASVT